MRSLKGSKTLLLSHFVALFTVFVWSATFITTKILLNTYTVTQLMVMRFAAAYLVLLLFSFKHISRPKSWKEEGIFFFLGSFGATIFYLLVNEALKLTTSANVSIITSVAPMIALILAHYFLKEEKSNKRIWFGSLIALSGVAFVVLNGSLSFKLSSSGDFIAVLAAVSWAVYSILLKKYSSRYPLLLLARKMIFYALVTSVLIVAVKGETISVSAIFTPVNLFSFISISVFGSGICYALWGYATKNLGLIKANNYMYLGPFITMAVGAAVLKETVTPMAVIGSLFIITGIFVSNSKKNSTSI